MMYERLTRHRDGSQDADELDAVVDGRVEFHEDVRGEDVALFVARKHHSLLVHHQLLKGKPMKVNCHTIPISMNLYM